MRNSWSRVSSWLQRLQPNWALTWRLLANPACWPRLVVTLVRKRFDDGHWLILAGEQQFDIRKGIWLAKAFEMHWVRHLFCLTWTKHNTLLFGVDRGWCFVCMQCTMCINFCFSTLITLSLFLIILVWSCMRIFIYIYVICLSNMSTIPRPKPPCFLCPGQISLRRPAFGAALGWCEATFFGAVDFWALWERPGDQCFRRVSWNNCTNIIGCKISTSYNIIFWFCCCLCSISNHSVSLVTFAKSILSRSWLQLTAFFPGPCGPAIVEKSWMIDFTNVFFKILDYVWLRNIYIDITSMKNEAFIIIIIGKS